MKCYIVLYIDWGSTFTNIEYVGTSKKKAYNIAIALKDSMYRKVIVQTFIEQQNIETREVKFDIFSGEAIL